MAIDRTVRRSQTITPFGVGGIYDFGSESFVAMDTSKWKTYGEPDIRLPRLEQVLGVHGFRAAPIAGRASFLGARRSGSPVPYMRFPSWLFCPKCRSMQQWSFNMELEGIHPSCSSCGKKSQLVPMRFMAVCRHGHLSDIHWGRWAHYGAKTDEQRGCKKHKLLFKTQLGSGAGLQSLVVECVNCKAVNDLERLPFKDSLESIINGCQGRHPWQPNDLAQECDQMPQVVQRGASNAYYPLVKSAIDIRVGEKKEDSIFDQIRLHPKWQSLVDLKDMLDSHESPFAKPFINAIILDQHLQQLGVTAETVWECLHDDQTDVQENSVELLDEESLLYDEWNAFISPPQSEPGAEFIANVVNLNEFSENLPAQEQDAWIEFRRLVGQITLAKKLRIVKALKGFTRLEPDYENLVTPSLGASTNWLPATEIYGEGIFISLDQTVLKAWEKRLPQDVLASMRSARKKTTLGFLPEATDRFVLLHTLSHLLIRQLCFECGYSSSSLSERI